MKETTLEETYKPREILSKDTSRVALLDTTSTFDGGVSNALFRGLDVFFLHLEVEAVWNEDFFLDALEGLLDDGLHPRFNEVESLGQDCVLVDWIVSDQVFGWV